MKSQKIKLLIVVLLTLSGCGILHPQNPSEIKEGIALEFAVQSYTETLHALADLRAAGKLTDEQIALVNRWQPRIRDALDRWRAAWEKDAKPKEDVRSKVRRGLFVLMQLLEKANNGT